MSSTSRSKRNLKRSRNAAPRFETLEDRRMFSALNVDLGSAPIMRHMSGEELVQNGRSSNDADIVWVNRAQTTAAGMDDTDGFGQIFGASAPVARAVVDAVIVEYERMIGSFNYGAPGGYGLYVNMATNVGFSGGLLQLADFNGKPAAGQIFITQGIPDAGDPNDSNQWFLDPTPFDNSEFTGNIDNAFAGRAQQGSPALGNYDFFTAAANAMTNALGMINLPMWLAKTVSTSVPDTGEGGGVGKLWRFEGPSIGHLLTSYNGGTDSGAPIHSAAPGAQVYFNGDMLGAEDVGNILYQHSERNIPSQVFALMFKDAYNYSTNNPAQWGTFYSNLNQTTGALTVRGGDFATGQTNISDTITISRSGNTVTVSVDPGTDVPATGELAGAGNLPAWVSQYDISQITSITVDAGGGDDAVNISAQLGVPVTVQGGNGADVVNFNDPAFGQQMVANLSGFNSGITSVAIAGGIEACIMSGNGNTSQMLVLATAPSRPVLIFGGSGSETITLSITSAVNYPAGVQVSGGGGADVLEVNDNSLIGGTSVYSITGSSVTKNNGFAGLSYSNVARLSIIGETGQNTFNVSGGSIPIWLNGGVTQDTYNVNDSLASAPSRVVNASGSDVLNVNMDGGTGNVFAETAAGQSFGTINVGPLSRLDVVAGSNSFVKTAALSVNAFNGYFNLNDSDLILDYSAASQLAAVQGLINQARNGAAWNGSLGITSFTARDNPLHNTTLGAMEASDYKSIYGPSATFNGQPIDNTAVLVKYTYYGDTDFNGIVDFDDYSRIDSGFNGNKTGWMNGDVDGNGIIDFDDYSLMDQAFNTQGSALRPALLPYGAKPGKAGGVVIR